MTVENEVLTSVYRCPDGTEFPVTWEEPGDVRKTWKWEQEHAPDPMKPLEMAMGKLTRPGTARAFEEADVPTPALFRGGRIGNGYVFFPADLQLHPDEQQSLYNAVARLVEREGGVWEVWAGFCLPRIEAACAKLLRSTKGATLAEIGEMQGYGMRMTHVAGSHALFASTIAKFVEFGNEIGVDGERLFVDLSQGFPNTTFKANAVLWDLAEIADRLPSVRATLLESESKRVWDTIRGLSDGQEFVSAFEAYLEQYGCRAGSWSLSAPTWQEDPAAPLRMIRRILEEKPPTPEETLSEGAKRRAAVTKEIEDRLGDDADRLARFREMCEPLRYYIPIREARAYWQLVVTGIMRGLLLKRGQRLVERGVVVKEDDVLYLVPEEIESALLGEADDLSSLVDERREKWEFWAQRRPPEAIGGEGEAELPDDGASSAVDDGVIRGVAASRGVVTARARVLADIGDADRLQRGDVLVCAMSSPPWTPLFALASGVVTDSGGILSHPAIVAREYGIPCVVGTRVGTEVIRDGAMITVDGDVGTVRVEG